jgi:predicted phosphodiesterase/mono/diheme cytochrome c family protein
MGFRFIHAADIHLDSPMRGLSSYETAPVEQLRGATREALKKLVTTAIEDQVSFVVIAGDLYDGSWKDYRTGIFFAQQMGRLSKAGIRAYVLYGNHDAENEMTKSLKMPDNVRIFASRSPEIHKIEELKVALHGRSFPNRAVDENFAAGYKGAVKDCYNIGVLHTALEGYAAHPTYAPCTVDELHAKGYDYWALGHVHEFQQWDGASTIVFPGNLQGRSIRETGRKGAVSVTVNDAGKSVVERLYLDVLRWEVLKVDVSDCTTLDGVAQKVGRGLSRLLEQCSVCHAVRVVLEGSTPLHGLLFGSGAALRAQVIAQAASIDSEKLWVEKVSVATSAPWQPPVDADSHEAMSALQAILAEAMTDPDFLVQLQQELAPFLNKLSSEVQHDVPLLTLAREQRLGDLVAEVAPGLLARLSAKVQ